MRIAIVSHAPLSFSGGAEKWIREVSLALTSRGHSVDVYTPADSRSSMIKPVEFGVREIPYRSRSLSLLRKLGLANFLPPFANPRLIMDYDVVYSASIYYVRLFLRRRGRLIVGTHDLFLPNRSVGVDLADSVPLLLLKILKSRPVKIHTLNPVTTLRLQRLGLRVFEARNFLMRVPPIDEPPSHPGFRVLFVGRLEARKGAELLAPLAEMISSEGKYELLVAGRCPPSARGLIGKLQALPHVHYLGEVSNEKRDELYRTSDAFLLLSDRESFSFTAVEAMSWGLPVVSTWKHLYNVLGEPSIVLTEPSVHSIMSSLSDLAFRRDRDAISYEKWRMEIVARTRKKFCDPSLLTRVVDLFEEDEASR